MALLVGCSKAPSPVPPPSSTLEARNPEATAGIEPPKGSGASDESEPVETFPETAPKAEGAETTDFAIKGTKVLHIGDSFAGALGIKLGELMKRDGVSEILEATDASYIVDWAHRKSLDRLVWKYNPDLVVVTLGANELAMVEPTQRARAIRKIVTQIGDRPCVWVAIPYWNETHNELMKVVEENSGPCFFHDTNILMDTAKMPRVKDGIHPTEEARAEWAKFFYGWLKKSRTPTEGRPWALPLRERPLPLETTAAK